MATIKLMFFHNNKNLMGEGGVYEFDPSDPQTGDTTAQILHVKKYYSDFLPELTNATWAIDPVKEGEEGKPIKVIFNKQIGTKGNDDLIGQMVAAIEGLPEFVPQVVMLAHQLNQNSEDLTILQLIGVNAQIKAATQEADTVVGVITQMEKNLCALAATPLPRPPLGF